MKKINKIQVNDKIWSKMYLKCKKYYEENSNLDIDNNSIKIWLKKQRYLYKNNLLSSIKIDLLNEINMDWFPELKRYNELIDMLKQEYTSINDLKENLYYQQLKTITSNDKQGFYLEITEKLKELEAGVVNG